MNEGTERSITTRKARPAMSILTAIAAMCGVGASGLPERMEQPPPPPTPGREQHWGSPIRVEAGVIVDGHHRIEAFQHDCDDQCRYHGPMRRKLKRRAASEARRVEGLAEHKASTCGFIVVDVDGTELTVRQVA